MFDNEKIAKLSEKVLDVALFLETLRDASLGCDNCAHAHVIELALTEQYNIFDELETMY